MFEDIRSFFTTRPKRPTPSLGAGASAEDDPAMPAFQKAWKDGAVFEDMFGPSPFTLHGSVGRSGADNFRPDVAKVETFLGDAGYYKPLTGDGPSGWHNTNLDQAIRTFQKDKGLEVDGFLKPNGPTIGKIGSLLGGSEVQEQKTTNPGTQSQNFWGGPKGDWPGVLLPGDEPQSPHRPGGRDPGSFDPPTTVPMPKPQPPSRGGEPGEHPAPLGKPQGQPKLVRGGFSGVLSERNNDPIMYEWFLEYPDGTRVPTSPPPYEDMGGGVKLPPPNDFPIDGDGSKLPKFDGPFAGHTINQDGIDANQGYAEMLVRDADPSQTARMLKRTIDDYGDQGRGDVADLLGRFRKIDAGKAEDLRRELHKATGEMLPYRIAPLGEGFREPTEEEKIAAAPKTPFGSAQSADRWAAGTMADALLGKGDYRDAVTHFRGEIGRNRAEAMPYLAAVHEIMGEKNPGLAARFATQMQKAGLAADAEKKPEETTPYPVPIPPAPTPAPNPEPPQPQPGPEPKPETTPFPVPIPPAPAPTPEPAPQPAPQPPRPPKPQPSPAPAPNPPGQPEPPKEPGTEGGQTKPSQTGRPPVEGHVAGKSIEEIEKEAEANGGWLNTQQDKDRGNEKQCTALVKQATGLGQASEWRAGDKIKGPDDPPLKPGTAIATFNDKGIYGTDKGRHAAIFVGYKEDNGQKGMEVLEQWDNGKVQRKFIPFSNSGKFIYQAGNYSVIRK